MSSGYGQAYQAPAEPAVGYEAASANGYSAATARYAAAADGYAAATSGYAAEPSGGYAAEPGYATAPSVGQAAAPPGGFTNYRRKRDLEDFRDAKELYVELVEKAVPVNLHQDQVNPDNPQPQQLDAPNVSSSYGPLLY